MYAENRPTPGQIVRVRSRQYLVEDVVPPPEPHQDTLLRLSCLDDDARGEELRVLWEHEVDAEILSGASLMRVADRGFDQPDIFSAYLHTLRWSCVTATNPRLLQSPYRAGIEVMAYQLEPLRKALLLPRVNLFIADDVGLGKTIEAGLILRELLMRQKVRRVVVAAPPSVVLQWRDELEQRFGLTFVVFDRDYVIRRRRERGFGVNPFTTHSRFVISHALLRDETYASLLRDWVTNDDHLAPELREPAILILDEAHNAAPASGSKYAIDSKFTKVVRELAPLFEHRLFLSATPHNGHSNSFSALLEILDPQRFCRGVVPPKKTVEAVMVRRLKEDLREVGLPGFPTRHVVQLDVSDLAADAPELTLARLLDEYGELRDARVAEGSKTARAAAKLVVTSLQKRLLSSIEAFACTLAAHRRGLERAKQNSPGTARSESGRRSPLGSASLRASLASSGRTSEALLQEELFDAPGPDDERSDLTEEDQQAQETEALEAASETAAEGSGVLAREREVLDEMTRIAEAARGRTDARVARFVAWVREHCLTGGRWNDRRVLVFTEYTDTKRYLDEQLRTAFARTDRADERVGVFHGGMGDESREEIKRAFNAAPDEHPLRILIATDAAREGVNLQNHCADLFHFDVPWNPSRMEQRNGRIDRKLQRATEVRCHYFVFTQRPEDAVLKTLIDKTKTIQAELGSLAPVLEARLGRILAGGIRRREVDRLKKAIFAESLEQDRQATVTEELDASVRLRREHLTRQLDGLRDLMKDAKDAIGFEESAFRAALTAGLHVAGSKGLEPVDAERKVWRLAEDAKIREDSTWTHTLDALRAPRKKGEAIWDWRKASPIRPVVFEDVGSLDDRAVHLHLEHRLVQRILGRFLAQGFVRDDLARMVALLSDDPVPRVVLLGRLSIFGLRGSRLHDQIIAVAARWTDPKARGGPLRPYAEDTKARTLELVDGAMVRARAVPEPTRTKLMSGAARDFSELEPALGGLAEAEGQAATAELTKRGDKEAKEMIEILETQKKLIAKRLEETEQRDAQLSFEGFGEDEKKQLRADQGHWRKRLGLIDGEIAAEPRQIRESYVTRAVRVEPVGLVYLWPISG